MLLIDNVRINSDLVVITTEFHEEPYFFYETGSQTVLANGETSDWEMYRRTTWEYEARDNQRKLTGIVRATQASYYERLGDSNA